MANGQSRDQQMKTGFKGNILFSTLLLFLLCSFLLATVVDTYQLTVDFNQRTKFFYVAQTMKELCLSEFAQGKNITQSGKYTFNTGVVEYAIENQKMKFQITVDVFDFYFTETIQNETVSSTE
ncbi:competence type IV pilus minor pilin ComGG [Candidatus Enterococcus courvalinii]|uniref:Competence protein ComGG n=1 Tax=Candidatus Enterococcus courvalinii TaxID=2815329 RepID=A0ABS3HYE4_9ENTE|nr:competence type IV pilus minor pilin ComGG [Enterococcus sp. MSG2901]MBO0480868.1 competence protein ComGG [Enterococcus sp. MSG2901]